MCIIQSKYLGLVLDYVYLRRTQTEYVPPEVYQTLPKCAFDKLTLVYLQAFINEIIGMHVNEEKSFMIAAADAYGDSFLFYNVTLLAIVYDSSAITLTSEITSETSFIISSLKTTVMESITSERITLPNITSLSNPFFLFFILFASVIVIKKKRRKNSRLE